MLEKKEIYCPSAKDLKDLELFGARFPLSGASLDEGKWRLEQEPVLKGKNPKLGTLRLADDKKNTFSGTPYSSSGQGDQSTVHFALVTIGDKVLAIPIDWFYVFKPVRRNQLNIDESDAIRKATADRDAKMTVAFNKKFKIVDEDGDNEDKGRVKAVSQLDMFQRNAARKVVGDNDDALEHLEPELDELFAMDEQRAEGWDYDEDVANNDIEAEVNREVAVERQEEELAELEQEHMEHEKVLKKEGRVDAEKEDDNDLKLELVDDDDDDEELPTVAAEKRREQEAEREGAKHMSKLRKRMKQNNNTLLKVGLFGMDDSDDSDDSDEGDSDEPPTQHGSPQKQFEQNDQTRQRDHKRERPEDMQDTFVAIKRANVPITSLLPSNEPTSAAGNGNNDSLGEADISEMSTEDYSRLAAAVREKWPKDPLSSPLKQQRLGDVIEIVKTAFIQVKGARMSKQMVKDLMKLATKGAGAGKPAIFKSAGKASDGKLTLNLVC